MRKGIENYIRAHSQIILIINYDPLAKLITDAHSFKLLNIAAKLKNSVFNSRMVLSRFSPK